MRTSGSVRSAGPATSGVYLMEPYKREFIDFMVRSGVLTFGDFVAKSGGRRPIS